MAKLMLVEDDNNLREIYEARLQAEGYTIVSAKDGEEALVLAKAEKPDLIISDIMMPKISGFEMLDILRNTDGLKDVKVIMLTALGQNDDQEQADRLGADRYLVKSQVTLEDIVKATHQLLNDEPAAATDPAPDGPAASSLSSVPAAAAPALVIPVATEPPATDTPAPSTPATTAAAPAGTDSPTPAPGADNVAQSTVQEEAAVESRIEDFVAGATEEATPPKAASPETDNAPIAEPEPTTSSAAPTPNETPSTSSADTASDDKLVSDAAQTLVDSTEVVPPEPKAETVIEPTPPPEPKVAPKPDPETNTGSVPIAHKKVIEPIDSKPKKDLDTLLAIEVANEARKVPPATPIPVIATNELGIQPLESLPKTTPATRPTIGRVASSVHPSETPAPPAPNSPVDPNSIAL